MFKQDIHPRAQTIQNDINIISSEILRLIRLPYSSWRNKEKIRTLDKQIEYLEELLAAYERDQKKHV